MDALADIPLISTIKERCRVCYTCVRECPAKAIRIKGGQAEVIEERCIGCGNCVKVCSQKAKQFRRSIDEARNLLASGQRVAACLAPSFPADFVDVRYKQLVGMVRKLGFFSVHEVGFGADLVAQRYHGLDLQDLSDEKSWIVTTCPAVVGFVERYQPSLVDSLAKIVSPMIALSRFLKKRHGDDLKVVFIGPCIAKKREALSRAVTGEISSVLTFVELRELFAENGIVPENVQESDFDPPHASSGSLFAMSRGLVESAELDQSLAASDAVSAEGRVGGFEALEELERGLLGAKILEVLACKGCIMGPGMTSPSARFARRACVAKYVRERRESFDEAAWRREISFGAGLNLSREFRCRDQRLTGPTDVELSDILARIGKMGSRDELNCGACGYDTCREHARAIHAGLAESEMCLPYTIEQLRHAISELAISHERLATAQEALMHAERLASMGQLAAGIAHEVNNPLGVVLMYSHLLFDECPEESPLRSNLQMIAEQATRCKRIVAGLLNFARQNKVIPQPVDLTELVKRSIRALATPPGIEVRTLHQGDPTSELDRDQMAQVLMNLVSNAYDAMPSGGTLTIQTGGDQDRVWIKVSDTGVGIPTQNIPKIFEPFFTTKPMGKGTGLGLSVTYGIVKMHYGDIQLESNSDPSLGPVGTTFTVTIPRRPQQER